MSGCSCSCRRNNRWVIARQICNVSKVVKGSGKLSLRLLCWLWYHLEKKHRVLLVTFGSQPKQKYLLGFLSRYFSRSSAMITTLYSSIRRPVHFIFCTAHYFFIHEFPLLETDFSVVIEFLIYVLISSLPELGFAFLWFLENFCSLSCAIINSSCLHKILVKKMFFFSPWIYIMCFFHCRLRIV